MLDSLIAKSILTEMKKLNEGEILVYIEQKLKEREPFYSQAKIKVDSKSLNENSFAEIASSIHL